MLNVQEKSILDYENIFDDEIAESYDELDSEMFSSRILGPIINKLTGLAGNERALEFAIGTGRVAIPLHDRGISVTGIEISSAMIAQLRKKIDGNKIHVIHGNMATTVAPGKFSLVYLVYNTISNLLTQKEQVMCFENAARHLLPGGYFVVELWVPELPKTPQSTQAVIYKSDDRYIALDTYDVVNQIVVSHHFRFGSDKQAHLTRTPHRYIWPSELDLMAQMAGFKLESRSSDWEGNPFAAESSSHVSVYRIID
jgi:SAM-dependent methyltransferase